MTPRQMLMWAAGVIGACSVIATAWVQIGGPVPVSKQQLYEVSSGISNKIEHESGLIKEHFTKVEANGLQQTEESAKWGRKIYHKELHDLLTLPPPKDPEQRQYWNESVEDAKKWRKFYSDKEIELRKK